MTCCIVFVVLRLNTQRYDCKYNQKLIYICFLIIYMIVELYFPSITYILVISHHAQSIIVDIFVQPCSQITPRHRTMKQNKKVSSDFNITPTHEKQESNTHSLSRCSSSSHFSTISPVSDATPADAIKGRITS